MESTRKVSSRYISIHFYNSLKVFMREHNQARKITDLNVEDKQPEGHRVSQGYSATAVIRGNNTQTDGT